VQALHTLQSLIETTVSGLGYELVDIELVSAGKGRGGLLRVYIDKPKGKRSPIDVNDCQKVSDQLQAVFMVENIDYDRLEISSPGIDRPLRKLADFARFAGDEANVKFRMPPTAGNRKNFEGVIAVEGEEIFLDVPAEGAVEAQRVPIDLANLDKARLKPQLDFRPASAKNAGQEAGDEAADAGQSNSSAKAPKNPKQAKPPNTPKQPKQPKKPMKRAS
jgi:ribosome maturation factor RimP